MRSLFMQAPAAISILRGSHHVHEFANKMYLQLGGKGDVLGKSIREAFPELVEQGFNELFDKVYATGEDFIGNELPFQLDSGDGTQEEIFLNIVY